MRASDQIKKKRKKQKMLTEADFICKWKSNGLRTIFFSIRFGKKRTPRNETIKKKKKEEDDDDDENDFVRFRFVFGARNFPKLKRIIYTLFGSRNSKSIKIK